MSVFVSLLLLVAFAGFIARRLLRYLHIFQQEEYTPSRFLRWIVETRSFDIRLSTVVVALFVLLSLSGWFNSFILAATFVLFSLFESDPRKIAKKKLVMTLRARRIFGVAYCVCLATGFIAVKADSALVWLLVIQLIPLSLAAANIILTPFENFIQRRIMKEASAKLAQIHPMVIGITGSFGKTSVKHILGHILEMNAPTLFTPGSVNTLMGISRIIRENLRSDTRYFLVEMGAYGEGSIKKLCALTPPNVGVITSLGEAHYERFKTLDAVAHAKFELAEAVIPQAAGKLVVHENVLAQEYAKTYVEKNRAKFIVCGTGPLVDLKIGQFEQTTSGISVSVRWQEQDYALFAPLYGEAHAGNMALAFAAALMLGVAPDRAIAAMRTVPQITHRLEVKPQADGTTYIDDAFNSNPRGFAAALDLLAKLADEKDGRSILITPGIVELGAKHDEAHKMLGEKAAQTVDVALVVRGDRIPSFVEAFQAAAPQKPLHLVANLVEAQKWLKDNAKPKDVFLIENDLPDLGEAKLIL